MPVDFFIPFLIVAIPILTIALLFGVIYKKRRVIVTTALFELLFTGMFIVVYLVPGWKLKSRAEAGDLESQYRLSWHYSHQFGYLWPNPDKARYWMLKAAENGHSEAMYTLGNSYSNDRNRLDLPVDLRKSRYWLGKALVNGVEGARSPLEDVEATIRKIEDEADSKNSNRGLEKPS